MFIFKGGGGREEAEEGRNQQQLNTPLKGGSHRSNWPCAPRGFDVVVIGVFVAVIVLVFRAFRANLPNGSGVQRGGAR